MRADPLQLPGGYVYSNFKLLAPLLPLGSTAACLVKDPSSKRNNKAGLFGDMYKALRRNIAAVYIPSYQGLGTYQFHAAAFLCLIQGNLGLVKQPELLCIHCPAHVPLNFYSLPAFMFGFG